MKRFAPALISVLLATACGWNSKREGKPVAVSISAQFESREEGERSPVLSLVVNKYYTNTALEETLNDVDNSILPDATPTPTPTPTPPASPTAGAQQDNAVVDSETLDAPTPEEFAFYKIAGLAPKELLVNAPDMFKFKRAYRWVTYKVTRGGEVLTKGSVKLDNPDVLTIDPVELEAFPDDQLRVSMSLLQLDFVDVEHKNKFCTHGSPALVRSWAGTTDYTVNAEGQISISLKETPRSTAHMTAVGVSAQQLSGLYSNGSKQISYDKITDQTFLFDVCPVSELQIAGSLDPDKVRHIRMLTLSSPLVTHKIGLVSAAGSNFFDIQPNLTDARFPNPRAMRLLGISATAITSFASNGSFQLGRIEPASMLGSKWELISRNGIPEKSEFALLYPKADFWVGATLRTFAIAGTCDVKGPPVNLHQDTSAGPKFSIEGAESHTVACAANGTFFALGSFGQSADGTYYYPKTYEFNADQLNSAKELVSKPGVVGYDPVQPSFYPTNASGIEVDKTTFSFSVPAIEPHSGLKLINANKISFSGKPECTPSFSLQEDSGFNSPTTQFIVVLFKGCSHTDIANQQLYFGHGSLVDRAGNPLTEVRSIPLNLDPAK